MHAGRQSFSDVDMVENVIAGHDQREKEHVACRQVHPAQACKSESADTLARSLSPLEP
jgi:hypothetical protein